jgi:hypothetical protein
MPRVPIRVIHRAVRLDAWRHALSKSLRRLVRPDAGILPWHRRVSLGGSHSLRSCFFFLPDDRLLSTDDSAQPPLRALAHPSRRLTRRVHRRLRSVRSSLPCHVHPTGIDARKLASSMPPAGYNHRPSMLGVPSAFLSRGRPLEHSKKLRLGVVRVLLRLSFYRPSLHRQTAEQDTRHDVRGLVVTALAACRAS